MKTPNQENRLNNVLRWLLQAVKPYRAWVTAGVIAFTVMLVINWKLTVACFLITPVVLFSIERVSRIEGTIFKEILHKLGHVTSLIHDVISNISIVKSYNLQRPMHMKFKAAYTTVLQSELRNA